MIMDNQRDSFLKSISPINQGISFIAFIFFLLIVTFHRDLEFSIHPSSFLSIHIVLETFSIVISLSIALQSWHLSFYSKSRKNLYLGALFLSLGIIDLMHTLIYKGMPFFNVTTNGGRATWFWVIARSTEALLLYMIMRMREKKISSTHKTMIFIGSFVYSLSVTFFIVFCSSYLPPLLDSQGVTPLKRGLEYGISLFHLMTIFSLLYLGKTERDYTSSTRNVWVYSLLALLFLLLGELVFTLYKSVYDIENFLGHIYKCLGYYFIYKGILVESIREPFLREQKANAQSEEYREELEQFFNLSLDALVITNLDGQFRRWNPTFQRILGYSTEELCNTSIVDLIHPQDLAKSEKKIKDIANGQNLDYLENRFLCKEGKIHTLAWSATPNLKQKFVYAVAKDITERKKIEQELARLDRLNLVAEMAAGISHEVRNPITTVRGFLQMLQAKEYNAHNYEYYQIMIEEIDRANAIITEFLSLGNNRSTDSARQNLNQIIHTLAPLIEADAVGQDKTFLMELSDVPELFLNKKEIRQILLNLTRNGLEATPSGGIIRVRTYVQENKVILAVQDQGSGIPAAVLEKLGTPFFTTKDNGTGLGLATCFSIAARHQAQIKIETGNAGTTFFVEFDPMCSELQEG